MFKPKEKKSREAEAALAGVNDIKSARGVYEWSRPFLFARLL
jgi:hypothetical protein